LSSDTPAITRGPNIEPLPASSTPQICTDFIDDYKY